jgi:hypothetical protein
MDWLVYLHVLSIVIWIGGVAFVTAILLPTLKGMEDSIGKEIGHGTQKQTPTSSYRTCGPEED